VFRSSIRIARVKQTSGAAMELLNKSLQTGQSAVQATANPAFSASGDSAKVPARRFGPDAVVEPAKGITSRRPARGL